MRTLGVDYGSVRTGLALSDPLGVTCSPLEIIVERDEPTLVRRILERAASDEVGLIVVGLPRPLSGGTNAQLERAESFLRALAEATTLPVRGWDERFTSKLATSSRAASSRTRRRGAQRPNAATDDVAACHLLQNYLDAQSLAKAPLMTEPQEERPYDPDEHLEVLRRHRHRRTSVNRRGRRLLVIVGFVILVVLVTSAVLLWVGRGPADDPPSVNGPTKQVQIPEGLTADAVARLLETEGIIVSAQDFVEEMQARGVTQGLKPGIYALSPGEAYDSILAKLTSEAAVAGEKVTIPEGLSIDQTAARLTDDEPARRGRVRPARPPTRPLQGPAGRGHDAERRHARGTALPRDLLPAGR